MTCTVCTKTTIQAKDGLCKGCRLRSATKRRQKYFWTPELDAALRRAYRAKNKTLLASALVELVRRTGWPRYILQNRAQTLGLRMWTCERWEPAEIEALREMAGEMPVYKIAKKIGRSASAVTNKLFTLDLLGRHVSGYSVNELGKLLGVHHAKIETWISRRWLSLNDDYRIPQASVERFVWQHMDEYRFANCEEWWLKTMLNPQLGVKHTVVRKPVQKEAA